MTGRTVILSMLLAALVAGCGGGGSRQESAPTFVKRITLEFSRGQSGRLWDELHPAEQAAVTRTRFIACERNEGFGLKSVKLLETYPETIDVAGRNTPSTAVSVRVTSDDGITTATLHAVLADGKWRWILQPSELAEYRQGRCPSG
jgi:hypothetical protein